VLPPDIQRIDKQLFSRLAQGSEEAFRELVSFYRQRLLPPSKELLGTEAALDVMQDVLLRLWLKRETLSSVEHPYSWLKTVVSNAGVSFLRTTLSYELRNLKVMEDAEQLHDPQEDIDLKSTQAAINEAVDNLSEKRKQVFLLSRRHGLSHKQIADKMGISEHTVRNHVAKAVSGIQEHLKSRGILLITVLLVSSPLGNSLLPEPAPVEHTNAVRL
jgi:RNA polymerase sigma factor (sigma-70 family)